MTRASAQQVGLVLGVVQWISTLGCAKSQRIEGEAGAGASRGLVNRGLELRIVADDFVLKQRREVFARLP